MAIFIDTGKIEEIKKYYEMGIIRGVTTNPTILVKDGVTGGMEGVKIRSIEIAKLINPLPLSVEVTSNDTQKMLDQAIKFSKWADNINVKITIHGPYGELDNLKVIHELEKNHDVRINVTAMMTINQVKLVLPGLADGVGGYVSVFAGRIADAGIDPLPVMKNIMDLLADIPNVELIWASPRELFNIVQADSIGCHIITATNNILRKFRWVSIFGLVFTLLLSTLFISCADDLVVPKYEEEDEDPDKPPGGEDPIG